MEKYYIASFSGGKDSTAMLLRLLELGKPVDEVIFCDTYKEFPAMYRHIQKVKDKVEAAGIKFTTLKNEQPYDFYMFDDDIKRKKPEEFIAKYGDVKGYSWADFKCRWCSYWLKVQVKDKYIKELKKTYKVIEYIGLAADETNRLNRKSNKQSNHIHPLADWGWTEKDCLNYCYSLGYDWEGLYKYFERVSCWCCPLQSLEDLRNLRRVFPELWEELLDMDKHTWRQFRSDYSVEDLDKRFAFEEQRIAEGKSIRSREFYQQLKEVLADDLVKP